MPRATLTLSIPDVIWIGALSRAFPEAGFRVLAAVRNDEMGVALIELSAFDPETMITEMRAEESVSRIERLGDEGDETLLQLETTAPLLLTPIQQAGVPLEMPFQVRDGEIVWEVRASRSRLSKLVEHLDRLGIQYTVDSISQAVESERLLTDHQFGILETAIERGYYDTPRRCTQEDLAGTLGIAKSTCSETLHRAEERIIKRFIETYEESKSTEWTGQPA